MTDQHPEAITIPLGGKDRRLKFGMAAFRRAEIRGVRIPVEQLLAPTLGMIPLLIWIGLLKDEPDLKEDTVLAWLDDADDEVAISKTVMEAFQQATMRGGVEGKAQGPTAKRRPKS